MNNSNKQPRGLGRGLEAVLGGAGTGDAVVRRPVQYINKDVAGSDTMQAGSDVMQVPADRIDSNPFQPRQYFDGDALDELAASIRTLGLIQPVTLRRIGGGRFQIIAGERRFRACVKAGMTMIPAFVRDATDVGMHEMAIVENVQRVDLDPIELALGYQRLIDECNLTQEEMASRVGKNRTTVANTLRLLKLPVKVQHDIKVGLVSPGHARALLALDDASAQERLCDRIISEGMSVRELEDLVRRIVAGVDSRLEVVTPKPELPEEYSRMISYMGKYFGSEISVRRHASGKGSMTIRFSSDEEVEKFIEALEKSDL